MTWDKLDRKTRIFLAAVGIAVLWLLWPSGAIHPQRPPRLPARPQVRQAPRPAPRNDSPVAHVAAPPVISAPAVTITVPSDPVPPAAVSAPLAELLGIYQGNELLPGGRGECTLRLELVRSRGKEGEFTGYTRLVCTPSLQELMTFGKMSQQAALEALQVAKNPTAAIVTGPAVDGSIRLHAVNNFGVRDARDGCNMTALSATPGGTNTIDVDWQESQEPTGVCRGAQMQMRRVRR